MDVGCRAFRNCAGGYLFLKLLGLCFPGPGLAPAGEVLFFASPKKRTQKKGDPKSVTPFAFGERGNLRCSRSGCRRGTHCAALQLRSDSHGESVHEACVSCGTHAHPPRCASRHGHTGGERLGPSLRSAPAWGSAWALQTRRRSAPRRPGRAKQ
ncbi:MAG: hypothetical protein EOO32_06865 [Comamonadaceae bacterium]|nr:MAG: hypothetical protein EOO32_06865 [Comamonadaceae bacterium]